MEQSGGGNLEHPGETILSRGDLYSQELSQIGPSGVVHVIYNPLEYARKPWATYLRRFAATPKPIVFVGMNPGPWGMAQTGIPFGEVHAVKSWLHITDPVDQPPTIHPKRPIAGMECTRSEVSGRRLWGLFRRRFVTAEAFFTDHMVINYCPLVFLGETGRNITPDRLPKDKRNRLFDICDRFLVESLTALQPETVVGIGVFATDRVHSVRDRLGPTTYKPSVVRILHPSPASPKANRGWEDAAERQLVAARVWP